MDCAPVNLWICCHGGYWGMVHCLCIWKSQAKNILNHYWYVVLFKKIDFNVMIQFSKHSLKISPQFNFSSGFHTDFGGGCFQNWSSVNKPQGQKVLYRGRKCILPGQKSIVPCYNTSPTIPGTAMNYDTPFYEIMLCICSRGFEWICLDWEHFLCSVKTCWSWF